jgi:AdoMet-dependent heme synthase
MVITGGDPLQREDLFELIEYGRSRNIIISVTPAGTARLTAAVVHQLKEAGVFSLGLSLDGSTETATTPFAALMAPSAGRLRQHSWPMKWVCRYN